VGIGIYYTAIAESEECVKALIEVLKNAVISMDTFMRKLMKTGLSLY